MKAFKCEKCGHEINPQTMKEIQNPKCPHCNQLYEFDKKANRNIYLVMIPLMVMLVIIWSSLSIFFKVHFLLTILVCVVVGVFMNSAATWLAAKLKLLSYQKISAGKKLAKS